METNNNCTTATNTNLTFKNIYINKYNTIINFEENKSITFSNRLIDSDMYLLLIDFSKKNFTTFLAMYNREFEEYYEFKKHILNEAHDMLEQLED